jgi:alpha-tubulin suppressor-like RCC1 family protein
LGFACGLRSDDTVVCWGQDYAGIVTTAPSGSFVAMTTGCNHACALKADGTVVCWGDNNDGQLNVP